MPASTEFDDFESFSPVMTREEMVEWFTRRLNRPPEANDVLLVGKEFYQLGAFSRALVCLQFYVNFPNALSAGRHLLAYCYLSLGELESAFHEFKSCVLENFHEDWQLVVELAIEIEQARKQHAAQAQQFIGGGVIGDIGGTNAAAVDQVLAPVDPLLGSPGSGNIGPGASQADMLGLSVSSQGRLSGSTGGMVGGQD